MLSPETVAEYAERTIHFLLAKPVEYAQIH